MIAIIFCVSILLFSSMSLVSTTKYSAIDNTFVSLNYSLPNEWVELEPEGYSQPMYDRTKVESTTISHVKSNLKSHFENVQVGFYYFDSETLKELDTRYITGVRVSLKASITPFRKYSRAMSYSIVKKD